jgi:Protein of unknown function (DUF3108)
MVPDPKRRWSSILELAFYVPLAAFLTYPLLLHLASRLTAPMAEGDPYLNLWILGWDLRTLSTHPLAFLTGQVFNANIFHPATNTLAYSDNFLLQAIALWPLYAVTHNVVLCYNALLFVSFVANAAAMHLLVRDVTGSRWGAWLAGVVWGFWPYHYAHLLQLQLQALYFLPLAFLFLHRLSLRFRHADAVALGLCAAAQAISAAYYGVMAGLALAVASVVLLGTVERGRRVVFVSRLAIAAAVALICVAPVVWPYWRLQLDGFVRTLFEAGEHGALLRSYGWVPETSILHRVAGMPSGPAATDTFERQLFPGFTVLALAAAALYAAPRRQFRTMFGAMLLLIPIGVVLSLGPEGARGMYSFVHRYVFGFQAIRVPARFGILVVFGLAVIAGFGLRDAMAAWRRRFGAGATMLAAACLTIVITESIALPLPSVATPTLHTGVGEWLARSPRPGAVLYLPVYPDKRNTPAMLASLEHGRPIVNGHSGSRPPWFVALVETLQQFPSTESLWALHELNVAYVVSQAAVAPVPAAFAERARFPEGVIYELLWTPETAALLAPSELPPPPEPGVVSLGQHETADYAITWETSPGGLHLTAATLTIVSARAPSQAPAPCATPGNRDGISRGTFHLTGFVKTADWVSRFFQATDCFDTWVDERLLPLVAEQERHEGRRSIAQSATYDAAGHVVRLQTQIALPLPIDGRDALSALFYARTLPLRPGDVVDIPVNESGRNINVRLRVLGEEVVMVSGKATDAIRVEPELRYRLATRKPIQITLWLSRDGRRLPLAMAFHADFGSFRAELQSYHAQ